MKHFIIFTFAISCLSLKAQHNHTAGDGHGDENEKSLFENLPQHGGEIVDAGKYKFEVLVNPMELDEKLTLYVLKKNYKEIELKEATATVIFRYKDGKTDTIALFKLNDKFTMNSIDPSKMANMIFNLKINNRNVSGVYFYKGLIKN